MNTERKVIVLVDDNVVNLAIACNTLIEHYNVFTVASGEKLFRLIGRIVPDLILLDIEMPEMSGYDIIKILKGDERWREIPVIFLTGRADQDSEAKGLSLGAIDYIFKPFTPGVLLKRVENYLLMDAQRKELIRHNHNLQNLVEEKQVYVIDLQNAFLKTIGDLVEYRDGVTGSHIERTQAYFQILVEKMLETQLYQPILMGWDLELLYRSTILHDVGKICIPDSILSKPGKLTDEEFAIMKDHCRAGERILTRIEKNVGSSHFLMHAKKVALSHHEKWNGFGYPCGLSGRDIPLQGRIMAIADVYDALTSERPYKKRICHEKAVKIINDGSGTHFEPDLVDIFNQVTDQFEQVQMSAREW